MPRTRISDTPFPRLRISRSGHITVAEDETGEFRAPTQEDMDDLPVGPELSRAEIDTLDG